MEKRLCQTPVNSNCGKLDGFYATFPRKTSCTNVLLMFGSSRITELITFYFHCIVITRVVKALGGSRLYGDISVKWFSGNLYCNMRCTHISVMQCTISVASPY